MNRNSLHPECRLLWEVTAAAGQVALPCSIIDLVTHSFIQDISLALGSCTHKGVHK